MANPSDFKFLVVSNLAASQIAIRITLERIGYTNFSEAADGAIALTMLQEDSFNFVISGIHLPSLDGLALLRAIKRDPKLRHIPVIMISATTAKEVLAHAIMYGAAGYVSRSTPGAANLLQEEVGRIINQASPT